MSPVAIGTKVKTCNMKNAHYSNQSGRTVSTPEISAGRISVSVDDTRLGTAATRFENLLPVRAFVHECVGHFILLPRRGRKVGWMGIFHSPLRKSSSKICRDDSCWRDTGRKQCFDWCVNVCLLVALALIQRNDFSKNKRTQTNTVCMCSVCW